MLHQEKYVLNSVWLQIILEDNPFETAWVIWIKIHYIYYFLGQEIVTLAHHIVHVHVQQIFLLENYMVSILCKVSRPDAALFTYFLLIPVHVARQTNYHVIFTQMLVIERFHYCQSLSPHAMIFALMLFTFETCR